MSSSTNDPSPLQIRCPSCGQRFKVGADLRDRTVECGSCEHRFRITDEVVQRIRKVYPGERRDAELTRFQRVPLASAVPMNLQTASYAEEPDPSLLEPPTPQRAIAGLVGVVLLVILALLLILGASRGGFLDGMPTLNRQVLAGFVSMLAGALLVYANPRTRLLSIGGAILAGVVMVSLPLFFKEGAAVAGAGNKPTGPVDSPPPLSVRLTDEGEEDARLAKLREEIGTAPLEQEQQQLAEANSGKKVYGLWLRDLRESNKLLVRDYLLRATGAAPSSHLYPRDNGDYLAVVTGVDMEMGELARLTAPFGTMVQSYDELGIVEVKVNNSVFVESPLDKLTNKSDPAFYELNKRELDSIDPGRVSSAVARLAESEPKLFRADITARLIGLLRESGLDFKGNVCRALMVWAEDLTPAVDPVLAEVERLAALKFTISKEFFHLLAKVGDTRALAILDELWVADSTEWSDEYANFGSAVEPLVIRRFPSTDGVLRRSAVQMLGRVGGRDSLPVLEAAKQDAPNAELRAQIAQSISQINERINR
jgi:hypothetical protein